MKLFDKKTSYMIKTKTCLFIFLVFSLFHLNLLFAGNFLNGPDDTLSESLMNTTFKIQGSGKVGTVFIMSHRFQGLDIPPGQGALVLFTAAHVLDEIKEDQATIYFRKKIGKIYKKIAFNFKIRHKGKPLWVKHPEVDIACMPVSDMPEGLDLTYTSTEQIATDDIFETKMIIPGDKLFVLGYPFGIEADDAGFPILRTGTVASYPLSPIKDYKTFLLDFDVFGGNSGGPVFVQNRLSYGTIKGEPVNYLVGVVIGNYEELKEVKEEGNSKQKIYEKVQDLGLAIVVHAQYMKELLQNFKISLLE